MKKLILLFIIFLSSQSIPQNFWQQTSLDSGRVAWLSTNSPGDIFASVWSSVGHSAYCLYRSTDGGDTWDTLSFGFPNPGAWRVLVVPNDGTREEEIYVPIDRIGDTTGIGIYYSSDNGDTWQRRTSFSFIIDLATSDSGKSILAARETPSTGGVYLSVDSCRSWARITPDEYGYRDVVRVTISQQGSYIAGVFDCGNNPCYGVIRSSDNGTTWTRHRTWSLQGAIVRGFLIPPPQGDIFLVANDDGVNRGFYEYDGQIWGYANEGIPPWVSQTLNAIIMDSSGTLYIAENFWGPANSGGIFRSTDNGNSWSQWNSGLPNIGIYSLTVNSQGYIFAGGSRSGVFRSAQPVGAVLSANPSQIIFPQIPIGAIALDSFTVYSQNSVPLIITSAASTDPAFTVSPDSITISPRDSAVFYIRFAPDSVGQYSGEIVLQYNGRLSPDSILVLGDAVIPVELISFTASVIENKVELNWSTATEINNSGFEIQRSGDSPLPGGERKGWVSIGFVPGFGTTTEPKSYSFTDESPQPGKYYYRLKQIDFDGTFKYSNEIKVDINFTPKEFVLFQNYPNPFNPTTSIKFSIPEENFVTVEIFNIIGERVSTLVNNSLPAGFYDYEFSAENLTSGIYLTRIKAGDFVKTIKMNLMK